MPQIASIGVLAHPLRPHSFPVAERIYNSLRTRGIDTWIFTSWTEQDVQEHIKHADLVVAIGGDGAMLRAARVCAPFDVPVLGINMGQLGFLTEIAEPDEWEQNVQAVLNGDFWIENRTMLSGSVWRGETMIASNDALNDIVISGGVVGHMSQLETYIDHDWTTTYYADALVVATATGSTAYALALGGPILPPELGNILIIPAAPHLSMDRPIVLSQGAQVEVIAASSSGHVVVTADGTHIADLALDDRVRIQASANITRFIRLRERNYFYRSLLDRMEPRVQRQDGKRRRYWSDDNI